MSTVLPWNSGMPCRRRVSVLQQPKQRKPQLRHPVQPIKQTNAPELLAWTALLEQIVSSASPVFWLPQKSLSLGYGASLSVGQFVPERRPARKAVDRREAFC